MSRRDHFTLGASDPESMHPALGDKEAGANWTHIEPRHIGFVSTPYLLGMRGNDIADWGVVNQIREDIRSGKGITGPIVVEQDVKGDGNAFVGEGNHRLAAAALEGLSHVPTAMYRKKYGRDTETHPRYPGRKLPGRGEMWDEYYHPSKAFPEDKVWKP